MNKELIKNFKIKKLAYDNTGKSINISELTDMDYVAHLLFEEYDNGSISFTKEGTNFIIQQYGLDSLADLLLKSIKISNSDQKITKIQIKEWIKNLGKPENNIKIEIDE